MKPKASPRRLKPTPTSSPLVTSKHLDEHGEPAHPDLVRFKHDDLPDDDEHIDVDLYLGPCLCKNGTGVARTFWFWCDDGGQIGMMVRSLSYSDGARAARAEFERCSWIEVQHGVKIVRLACVEIHDELSEARAAASALQPRTHW